MNRLTQQRATRITAVFGLLMALGACAPHGQAASAPTGKVDLGKPKARVTYHDNSVEVALYFDKRCQVRTSSLGEWASEWAPCGEAPIADKQVRLIDDSSLIEIEYCKGARTSEQGVIQLSQKQCPEIKPGDAIRDELFMFVIGIHEDGTYKPVLVPASPIDLHKIEPYRTQNDSASVAKKREEDLARLNAEQTNMTTNAAAKEKAAWEAELERLKPACSSGDKASCVHADFVRNKLDCASGNGQACFAKALDIQRRIDECGAAAAARSDTWCPSPQIGIVLPLADKKHALQAACDLHYEPACQALPGAKRAADTEFANAYAAAPIPAQSAQSRPNFAGDSTALKSRCSSGNNGACAVMGFVTRCQQGNADGCDSAGNAYMAGTGVTKDLSRTKTYWIQACTMAASRCAGYGMRFQNTPGFQQDAQVVFDMGCQGDANQCVTVGTLFLRGAGGTPRDATKARAYFKRACDAGVPSGCQSLQLK